MLNHRRDEGKPDQDLWELVGGGVEEGEEPVDAIKREMVEELGYSLIKNDDLTLVKRIAIEHDGRGFEIYYFKATFPGFANFSDTDEVFVSDLKLFSLKEALNLPLLPITEHIILAIIDDAI